ncbi:hypothetical protein Tco_1232723 [Tanacetum coccineum]
MTLTKLSNDDERDFSKDDGPSIHDESTESFIPAVIDDSVDTPASTSNNINEINKFKALLSSRFMIKDLGKYEHWSGKAQKWKGARYGRDRSDDCIEELKENVLSGGDNEDAHEHIGRILESIDLFYVSGVSKDHVMAIAFPFTLKGKANK